MSTDASKKLRIIYAGTPDFSVPALQALIDSEHDVVAVYTQPDRGSGRGRKIKFGPVKQVAVDANLPVEQTDSLKTAEALAQLKSYRADVMIVAAYSLMLPQNVLDAPRYGCLNIHGSLLPRWRGAAPIHRAIQEGDKETGVTIMQMALGLDTGDMLTKVSCSITPSDTYHTIHDRLSSDGAIALMQTLDSLVENKLQPEVQNDALSCYAHKLDKLQATIDWTKPAIDIDRKIRAFCGWPVAQTSMNNKPLKFYMSSAQPSSRDGEPGEVLAESKEGIEIATGEGSVLIQRLQLPNAKQLDVRDFLNGRSLEGQVFPS